MLGNVNGEPLIVPLHVPLRSKVGLPIVCVGFVAWIVLVPGVESVVVGGMGLVCFGFVAALHIATRRSLRGKPWRIVADSGGIATPSWSVPWNRVSRMGIGGRVPYRKLVVEPTGEDSLVLPDSALLHFDVRLSRRLHWSSSPGIYELSIDRPVEELLAQLEAIRESSLGSGGPK
jgi:hypothetical protein